MSALTLKLAASWSHGSEWHSTPATPSRFLPLAVTRAVAAVARWSRIRRDTRHVLELSDHMLSDIGLTRSEIADVVRWGRRVD
jgi:uncharacterized protein YjiS (DUF1127 family)